MAFNQFDSGILKGMNPRVTITATALIVIVLIIGSLFTGELTRTLGSARDFLNPFLEWYYVLVVGFLLFFMVWLGYFFLSLR